MSTSKVGFDILRIFGARSAFQTVPATPASYAAVNIWSRLFPLKEDVEPEENEENCETEITTDVNVERVDRNQVVDSSAAVIIINSERARNALNDFRTETNRRMYNTNYTSSRITYSFNIFNNNNEQQQQNDNHDLNVEGLFLAQ